MPSWVPHLVVPALFALAFLPMPKARILAWAPVAWLPDLDYVIPGMHRVLSHSILIPVAAVGVLAWLWRRRDPGGALLAFALRPGAPSALTLGAYYFASHSLMDIFQGGVVLLWPLSSTNFYIDLTIELDTAKNEFTPTVDLGTSQGAPELAPVYTWLSGTDAAILVFLACAGAAFAAAWWVHRRGQKG